MGRNFGNYGFGLNVMESCTRRKNPWYDPAKNIPKKKSSRDKVVRYMRFLYDLEESFVDGGFARKAESVRNVITGINDYDMNPAQAIDCFVKKSAEWVPPTYNEYKVMWEYYYDLPTVVSRYYQGYTKPPATASATMVPTTLDEPAQQEAETTSSRGYQYRQKMRQRQRQRQRRGLGPGTGTGTGTQGSSDVSAGPFSTGVDFMPGSGGASPGSSSPQEVAISPDDVPDEGMGLGLKIAIGLGVLGIGAFVARRQGWI